MSLLHRLFDPIVAEAIIGDLEQERRRRAATSPLRARVWYWHAAFAIAAYVTVRRLVEGLGEAVMNRFGLKRPGGELVHAVRTLRRSPWNSATVIAVISLSMTLATTTFAIVDGVLFKPLPYRDADELFAGSGGYAKSPLATPALSPEEIQAWRTAAPEAQVASFGTRSTLGRLGDLTELQTVGVSSELLDVLGIRLAIGGFTEDDFRPSTDARPALISQGLWQRAFGGRPDILGATLPLAGGRPLRVAGVLPSAFVFPSDDPQPDALVPLPSQMPPPRPGRHGPSILGAVVRVPRAASLVEVRAKLDAAMRQVADAIGPVRTAGGPKNRASLRPLEPELTGRSQSALAIVATASATLVLLACLSLAGLGIARVETRTREVALRRAIGASAWIIARMQTVEAFILALIGTSLGVALTAPALATALRLLPDELTLLKTPAIDARVLLFAAGAVFVTSILIALWPATVAARTGIAPVMARAGRSTVRTRGWGRRILIASEIALALVLTVGGTLVVASLALVWNEDHGYSLSDSVVVELASSAVERHQARTELATIEEVVRGVGGIRATTSFDGPILQRTWSMDTSWKRPPGAGADCLSSVKIGVRGSFFDTLGLRPTYGRVITGPEADQGQPVVVLSETAARSCWEAGDALGQTVTMNNLAFTVVGVVPDVRLVSLDERAMGQLYAPDLTLPERVRKVLLARTDRPLRPTIDEIIRALRSSGHIGQVSRVVTLQDALAGSIRARRLNAWLFGVFAAAALAIVTIGILGLIAMVTSRRSREIGIRYALGGTRKRVVGLVLREQVLPVGLGLAVGALTAAWAGQFIAAYLYRFQPSDPRLWVIAVVTVIVAAAAGTLIPAWRASRVDPVEALRAE